MSRRVRNNVAQARYREINKLFSNFGSGDLVEIKLINYQFSSIIHLRQITKNDKGKFTYLHRLTYPRRHENYIHFNNGQIGLFLGRYDAKAVMLINEGLYSIPVDCIKKVEENNG